MTSMQEYPIYVSKLTLDMSRTQPFQVIIHDVLIHCKGDLIDDLHCGDDVMNRLAPSSSFNIGRERLSTTYFVVMMVRDGLHEVRFSQQMRESFSWAEAGGADWWHLLNETG